jgi:signal transduction histidine kinase
MRPNWPDLVRTTSFRLGLLYAGLFAVSALALFGVIYWAASETLEEQLDAHLVAESTAIESEAAQGGSDGLGAIITKRLERGNGRLYFLLQDATGRKVAGDLQQQRKMRAGYRYIELVPTRAGQADEGEDRLFRTLGRTLPDGSFLLIAEDAHAFEEFRELIARAFAWGGGASLLLAILGAGVMSSGVLRRVEAINRASERVMAGELSRRLPVRASRTKGDEFDRLAGNLNVMLDRIEHLVEGLRQVSTDIAHDLRTPLGRLRRTLEEARDGLSPETAAIPTMQIDRAIAEADALLATFGALLRIAQIETGALRREFGVVDMSSVLEAVLEVYGPAAEEKSQMLAGKIPAGVSVTGDRALLTQMVANLVENAIRHCPAGANIAVALTPRAGKRGIEITISDDGPGIPASERVKVFRRFYRLDASRGTPGNGLGLAMVAAIADLHGIKIDVADNEPQGLRIHLTFADAQPPLNAV